MGKLKKKMTRYDKITNDICPDCGHDMKPSGANEVNQLCAYCGRYFIFDDMGYSYEQSYVTNEFHQPEGLTQEEVDKLDDGVERHTIGEWSNTIGPIVMDPDGFNRSGNRGLMELLFTQSQFEIGVLTSTCMITPEMRKKWLGNSEKS